MVFYLAFYWLHIINGFCFAGQKKKKEKKNSTSNSMAIVFDYQLIVVIKIFKEKIVQMLFSDGKLNRRLKIAQNVFFFHLK